MTTPHAPLLPLARREFLRTTGLGCGSLALAYLLGREAYLSHGAERKPHFAPKAKSVIWIFLTGGPSHVDTFDYKPELQKRDGQKLAGADPKTGFFTTSGKCLKSPFKWQQHGQSGSWISEVFAKTAAHADDMAFLHSCHSVANNHAPASMELAAGQAKPGYPSMGAWVTYGLGSMNDNLPAFVVMHDAKPRGDDGIWSPGFLPKTYQPLVLDSRRKETIANVSRPSGLSDVRQRAMLEALSEANAEHQKGRADSTDLNARIRSFELAYRMQTAAPEALDIARETNRTQRLYGIDDPNCANFGRQLLMSRRLIERGVRFVQVFSPTNRISGGAVNDVPWDGHNDILTNHRDCGMMSDTPISGLLSDLKQRDLLKDTLVIIGGEFGRTSDSQGSIGRDHNPQAYTTVLLGGGVKGGVHHGATDPFGYKAVEDKVTVYDIQATVLHLLGLEHTKLTFRHQGRDFRLTDVAGNVIKSVIA